MISCFGHGGIDPGKVGVNNALEKDINLAIALKLERNLRENGINVVMTRTDDNGLYEESDSNKKVRDMKNRLSIIEEAKPMLAVSIHQNSYPDASVSGVQVFYYKDSVKSKEAAEIMQKRMIASLKPEKERTAKENSSYYLLKKTSVPIMIIECAFMSNPTEAELLVQDDYQEKVAWAIYMGIMQIIHAGS
ncbi:MAG: N-acetylmuramoyl-L-alanine amidase [Lachnospiraceae bacterium]|nr:N-acetylmuramoyl-L-alanine amidase [Lachnospiraceae bacterium]